MKIEIKGKIITCGNGLDGIPRVEYETEHNGIITAQIPIENVIESFNHIYKSVKITIETIDTKDSGIKVIKRGKKNG